MSPGQIIHIKTGIGDSYWYIEGIYIGGAKEESAVLVSRCDGFAPPYANGSLQPTYMPELMLCELLDSGRAKLYDEFEGLKHELTHDINKKKDTEELPINTPKSLKELEEVCIRKNYNYNIRFWDGCYEVAIEDNAAEYPHDIAKSNGGRSLSVALSLIFSKLNK